jgi:hypothetical protein
MCISLCTRFMTSTGQGEPAMIPVRRLVRSKLAKSGSFSSAMNIVGTPYSEVQRSAATAASTARGSNASLGTTMHAPCVTMARLPSTMPKQW